MKLHRYAAITVLSLAAAGQAMAASPRSDIEIDDPWVRATVPGQPNGAGYMEIENDGNRDDRLVEVRSPAAERVEIHSVDNTGGVARMRKVDGLDITADGSAKLSPGGFYIMFLKLKAPFKEGGRVPATLRFEHAGDIQVQFEVKPAAYNGGGREMEMAPGMQMKH